MIITALWKDSYKITVGDKECGEIETKENEITCLPPVSEPIDLLADDPRVRVGKNFWQNLFFSDITHGTVHIDIYFNNISSAY